MSKVVTSEPPKKAPVSGNIGQFPMLPGRPSANGILRQLHALDGLIHKQLQNKHRKEVLEESDPANPVFKGQKQAIVRELERLTRGRGYWQKELDKELARLKSAGAPGERLPSYRLPAGEPLVHLPDWLRPEDIGLDRSQLIPMPALPDPGKAPHHDPPSPNWDPDDWCEELWKRCEYDKAQNDLRNQRLWEDYAVKKFLFEKRREKAARERKPFLEKEPAKPDLSAVPIPDCSRPHGTPI